MVSKLSTKITLIMLWMNALKKQKPNYEPNTIGDGWMRERPCTLMQTDLI